jgi:hypothetical protein
MCTGVYELNPFIRFMLHLLNLDLGQWIPTTPGVPGTPNPHPDPDPAQVQAHDTQSDARSMITHHQPSTFSVVPWVSALLSSVFPYACDSSCMSDVMWCVTVGVCHQLWCAVDLVSDRFGADCARRT